DAVILQNVFGTGLDQPVGTGLGDHTGIGKGLTIFDPSARAPRVQQFSLDIQRELFKGIAMSLAYVGSRSTHLTQTAGGININQIDPRNFAGFTLANYNQSVANPYFGKGGVNAIAGA